MAASIRASNRAYPTTGTSTAVTKPTGTVTGDYLIAKVFCDNDGSLAALTAPTGTGGGTWSELSNSGGTAGTLGGFAKIFTAVATGTEPASYTFGHPNAATTSAVCIEVYAVTGHNTTTPIAASPVWSRVAPATTTSLIAPTVTMAAAGLLMCRYHLMGASAAATITPAAGMSGTSSQKSDNFLTMLEATQSVASGATGTKTATSSNSGTTNNQGYLTVSMGIRDAATGSTFAAAGTSAWVENTTGTALRVAPAAGSSPWTMNASGNPVKAAPQASGASAWIMSASGNPTRVPLTLAASGTSSWIENSTGNPVLLKPKTETLSDAFTTADTAKWANIGGTNPLVTGGHVELVPTTGYPSFTSITDYSLTGSYAFIEVPQVPATGNGTIQAWPLRLNFDGNNQLHWYYSGGQLLAEYSIGGVFTTLATLTYNATTHRWLRVREVGGTVYWDTSPDGITWTQRASTTAITWSLNDLLVYVGVGYYGTEPAPGMLQVDNFNVPATPVYQAAGTSAWIVNASGAVTGRLAATGTSAWVLSSSGNPTAIQPAQASGISSWTENTSGAVTARLRGSGTSPWVITASGAPEALTGIRGTSPWVMETSGTADIAHYGAAGTPSAWVIEASGDPVAVHRISTPQISAWIITASGTPGVPVPINVRQDSTWTMAAYGNPIVKGKPDQGQEILALFDEDEVLEGGRVTYYSFDLLDSDENLIGTLRGVEDGDITIDAYASVKATGKLTVFTDPQYADYPDGQPAFYGGVVNNPTGVVVSSTQVARQWYSGAYTDHDGPTLNGMGTWRNRPMDVASVFPTRDDASSLAVTWYLDPAYSGGAPVIAVGMPLCTTGQTVAQDLTSTMTSLANAYNTDGRIFMIRLGWEMNLNPSSGWPWAVTDANVTQWKSRFNAYANIFKSVMGSRAQIGVNPNIGAFQSSYSGTMDAFLSGLNYDWIGIDAYDCYPPFIDEASIEAQHSNGGYGLDYWASTARAQGKGLALPEWGVSSGYQWPEPNRGNDNPLYISAMKTWMDANADVMLFDAYFNDPNDYLESDIYALSGPVNNPDSGARYQQLFDSSVYVFPGLSGQVLNVDEGNTFVLQDGSGNVLSPTVFTVTYVDEPGAGLQDIYFTPAPPPSLPAGTQLVVVISGQTQVTSWLNVRIRPMIRIARLGGGDDAEGRLVAAGVYTVAAPVEKWTATGLARELELTDKLGILDQDIASGSTSTITAYTAPAGANIIALIQALIGETGETYPAIQPDTKTLPAAMVWDLGTTRLKIINDLLDAAGYFSLFCDGYGQYQAVPYVQPSDRVPVYESMAPFSNGPRSLMDPDWTRDRDIYSVPNRVYLVGQGDGALAALTSTATNTDPNSPYSFAARSRWITLVETGVEAVDQAALDTIARARLSSVSSVTEEFTLDHAYLPDLHINSVVRFVNPSADLSVYCYVVATSIPLDPLALATSTMRVVQ